MDSGRNQDQATDREELDTPDANIITRKHVSPELPTPDPTPEPPTPEPPTLEPTPAGPSGPLTRRTTRLEAVPKEQARLTREIYRVYVDDIVAICRRKNLPRL